MNANIPAHDQAEKKFRILVVDDVEHNAVLLEKFLKPAGAEIMHAGDGNKAVEICLSEQCPDLVLMDILMPVMSGIEAVIKIRETGNKVIIIAQTAYAQTEDRDKAMKAGCDDYITKPIRRDELLSMIAKYRQLRNKEG